jgi:hypothetical protein
MPVAFVVTPKWRNDTLYIGAVPLGCISRPHSDRDKGGLIAVTSTFIGGAAEFAETETDGRRHVEALVKQALAGANRPICEEV